MLSVHFGSLRIGVVSCDPTYIKCFESLEKAFLYKVTFMAQANVASLLPLPVGRAQTRVLRLPMCTQAKRRRPTLSVSLPLPPPLLTWPPVSWYVVSSVLNFAHWIDPQKCSQNPNSVFVEMSQLAGRPAWQWHHRDRLVSCTQAPANNLFPPGNTTSGEPKSNSTVLSKIYNFNGQLSSIFWSLFVSAFNMVFDGAGQNSGLEIWRIEVSRVGVAYQWTY